MHTDFQLITLGRLALVPPMGAADAGLNRQRRKLAVLAVLALARGPVSRDLLLEMFWGEQDESRARHSLSDALSHLRRALGSGAISARSTDVSLAEDARLRVDAVQFAAAVRAGDWEGALVVHSGPFLDAVYVGGSARFEQWVDGEARRMARLFQTACERRCAELAAREAWVECAGVARRWLRADPASAGAALALLRGLRGNGGREGELRALEEYEAHRRLLQQELGVAPDPKVIEVARQIEASLRRSRAEVAAPAPPAGTVAASGPPPPTVSPAGVPHPTVASPLRKRPAVDAAPPTDAGDAPVQPPQRAWRDRRVRIGVVAALALAAVLFLLGRRDAAPPVATTLAILPFSLHGHAEYGYLREGMVDLLSTNLDGAAGLRTVDPRAVLAAANADDDGSIAAPSEGRALAARLGAATYVMGDVAEAGGRLRITAAMYDVTRPDEPLNRAYAEGDADSLFAVVDDLTVGLIADRVQRLGGRLSRTAALTTSSIPALKAYLEGERHWRALRLVEAVESMRQATREDTAFALAWYRLGMASSWDAKVDVAQEAMERAVRHSEPLSARDRTLIAAYRDVVQRDPDEAERRYRAVVADYPTDVEAWAGLGEMWFHANPWRGRSFQESRAAWEQVLRLEPHNIGATWHLAYVSARQGNRAELDSLTRTIQTTVAGGADLSVRAIRAVAMQHTEAQDDVLSDLARADDFTLILAVWRIAVSTEALETVARFAELLTHARRPPEVRALGHSLQAHLHMGRGQRRAAHAELDSLARLDPVQALEYRTLLASFPLQPADRAALESLRDELRGSSGTEAPPVTSPADLWVNVHAGLHAQLRTYLYGLTSALLGSAADAERSAAVLDRTGDSDADHLARAQAREIRAVLLRARGHVHTALDVLDSADDMVDFGSARASPFFARSRQRFVRGELLRAAGRETEALGWFQGMGEIYPFDVAHLAPAHLRRAEIHIARDEHDVAATHLRAFLELWKDCDPELRPWLEHARRELAAVSHAARSSGS